MLPLYQLPPKHKAASTINLDLNPDQVGIWLAKLPLADAAESAEKLTRFLTAFNRIDLPRSHRRSLVGLIAAKVLHIADCLTARQPSTDLPLPQRRFHHLLLGQNLLGELANMHKLHILDCLVQGQTEDAAASLSELMDTADTIMMAAFRNHTALPAGFWTDLHQSYLCASTLDIDQSRCSSFTERYKAAMLLAMADPYQFTDQETEWARALATNGGTHSHLAAMTKTSQVLAPFGIQPTLDAPPQVLSRRQEDLQDGLIFDTTPVARRLAQLGNAIKTRRISGNPELPPEADWPAYSILLNKLKLRWGASKHRLIQRRRPHKETPYEITLGLNDLYSLVEAAPAAQGGRALCVPINDSAGGLALRHNGDFPMHIEVGEIIGLKQPNESKWQIGLIRWFKQTQAEELLFGLQLLGAATEAAVLRQPGSTPPQRGLLLRAPGNKQGETLILPNGVGYTDMRAELVGSSGAQAVTLMQRIDGNRTSEIFRVQAATE